MNSMTPLYDFQCSYCKSLIEVSDPIPPVCSACSNVMTRIWSTPAVHFKGSGFYSTDKGK